jgi:hypothetical protein
MENRVVEVSIPLRVTISLDNFVREMANVEMEDWQWKQEIADAIIFSDAFTKFLDTTNQDEGFQVFPLPVTYHLDPDATSV